MKNLDVLFVLCCVMCGSLIYGMVSAWFVIKRDKARAIALDPDGLDNEDW